MIKLNPENERIKRTYFTFLREALGRDEATIDGVAAALARFEASAKARDFKRFHREQAVAFKRKLLEATNARTGERLSKATMLSILRDLRAFFQWLCREPGYRSRLHYSDADYFNLADKDVTIARARREKRVPTPSQMKLVLNAMPTVTALERRDRALVALAMVTGARAAALVSFQIGHVNVVEGYVEQDAREVRTKFGKSFRTYFMPVSNEALAVVRDWHMELTASGTRGAADPFFPATDMGLDETGGFAPKGLSLHGWRTSAPARAIFRRAFAAAGLPYFNPHRLRDMLVRHALSLDLSPEGLKAWSQNLGHADVLTTLTSYGPVPTRRQGELIRGHAESGSAAYSVRREELRVLETVLARMKAQA